MQCRRLNAFDDNIGERDDVLRREKLEWQSQVEGVIVRNAEDADAHSLPVRPTTYSNPSESHRRTNYLTIAQNYFSPPTLELSGSIELERKSSISFSLALF
jgi:hypothetical protein